MNQKGIVSEFNLIVEYDGSLRLNPDLLMTSGLVPGSRLKCLVQYGQITLVNYNSGGGSNAGPPMLPQIVNNGIINSGGNNRDSLFSLNHHSESGANEAEQSDSRTQRHQMQHIQSQSQTFRAQSNNQSNNSNSNSAGFFRFNGGNNMNDQGPSSSSNPIYLNSNNVISSTPPSSGRSNLGSGSLSTSSANQNMHSQQMQQSSSDGSMMNWPVNNNNSNDVSVSSSSNLNNNNSNSDFWNMSNPFPMFNSTSKRLSISSGSGLNGSASMNGNGMSSSGGLVSANSPSSSFLLSLNNNDSSASSSKLLSPESLPSSSSNPTLPKQAVNSTASATSLKHRRKPRDPDAPKRNVSAYSIFTKYISKQVIKDNPRLDFNQRGHEIGARWKALSDEEKRPFFAAAALDRQRYDQECSRFQKQQEMIQRQQQQQNAMEYAALNNHQQQNCQGTNALKGILSSSSSMPGNKGFYHNDTSSMPWFEQFLKDGNASPSLLSAANQNSDSSLSQRPSTSNNNYGINPGLVDAAIFKSYLESTNNSDSLDLSLINNRSSLFNPNQGPSHNNVNGVGSSVFSISDRQNLMYSNNPNMNGNNNNNGDLSMTSSSSRLRNINPNNISSQNPSSSGGFLHLLDADHHARSQYQFSNEEIPMGLNSATGSVIRKKRRLDPLAPKRNVSAFGAFTKFVTPEIIREYPHLNFQDRAKLISQQWKNMQESDKTPYQELARTDKERYENELKTYLDECVKEGRPVRCLRWLKKLRMKPLEDFMLNCDGASTEAEIETGPELEVDEDEGALEEEEVSHNIEQSGISIPETEVSKGPEELKNSSDNLEESQLSDFVIDYDELGNNHAGNETVTTNATTNTTTIMPIASSGV